MSFRKQAGRREGRALIADRDTETFATHHRIAANCWTLLEGEARKLGLLHSGDLGRRVAMGRVNMASVMADRGLHATLVRTFLAAVMLSACSQEPAEQESGVPEPAQEQRAGARVDCRGEVAAAFERLKTSGRPYRKETTTVVSVPGYEGTFHELAEFLPPDRMRLKSNGLDGYRWFETILVGEIMWTNELTFLGFLLPWGWQVTGVGPLLLSGDMDRDIRAVPADTVFECLGTVEFGGATYIGYRARSDETKPQQMALQKMLPHEWRTVFVDPQSTLPAHDLVTPENELDTPRNKVRYIYPNDITIEPPVWCRLDS